MLGCLQVRNKPSDAFGLRKDFPDSFGLFLICFFKKIYSALWHQRQRSPEKGLKRAHHFLPTLPLQPRLQAELRVSNEHCQDSLEFLRECVKYLQRVRGVVGIVLGAHRCGPRGT